MRGKDCKLMGTSPKCLSPTIEVKVEGGIGGGNLNIKGQIEKPEMEGHGWDVIPKCWSTQDYSKEALPPSGLQKPQESIYSRWMPKGYRMVVG